MTIFELVKVTLDELYREGTQYHGTQIDNKIIKEIATLRQSYRQLENGDRERVNYRDPVTRFAYIYQYVAAHGDYIVQALEAVRSTLGGSNLFKDATLRLTCIGGGPGSDIVGVLKYLSDYNEEPVKKIICYLLDAEQAWADNWPEVGDTIISEGAVNVHFQPLDVTKPESWSAQKKFLKADLFTLSYFASEVCQLDDGTVSAFWRNLLDEASSGGLLLYVDNGHATFNQYFDKQWSERKDIEVLFRCDNTRHTPRLSEQKSELESYRAKFGSSPKLQSWILTNPLI